MSFSDTEARFDALCTKLSANHDSATTVGHCELPDGYGFRLGQALRNNTKVSSMSLDLRPSRVDGDNDPAVTDNISLILQFLERAASLMSVLLTPGTPVYTNACLEALSQNLNLRIFALMDGVEASAEVLADWLQTTQTLADVTLPIKIADNEHVAAALGANTSIDRLVVWYLKESSEAATLLGHISRRQTIAGTTTPLKELKLEGDVLSPCVLSALSELASSSSTIIPLLSIYFVEIHKEFTTLVHALSSHRRCMIAKIGLVYVKCNEATATKLLSSVEALIKSSHINSSRTSNATFAAAAACTAATLKEIEFRGKLENEGPVNVKLVTALTLSAQCTLERLDCKWFGGRQGDNATDFSLLWSKMEEHIVTTTTTTTTTTTSVTTKEANNTGPAPFRRLREIVLDDVWMGNNEAFLHCLDKLVSLQTLSTNPARRDAGYRLSATDAIRFAKAIRRNGSLTKVDMQGQSQWSATMATDPTLLTDRVDRIIVAALQRNKMLPILLARPMTGAVAAAAHDNQDDATRVLPPQGRCLHPHLFAAALPAEFMTPHFVLMGLTALLQQGDSVSDMMLPAAKRSAPSTME